MGLGKDAGKKWGGKKRDRDLFALQFALTKDTEIQSETLEIFEFHHLESILTPLSHV